MLAYCGGTVQKCIDWFTNLSVTEKALFAGALFLGIFVILRIFHYFTKDIDGG